MSNIEINKEINLLHKRVPTIEKKLTQSVRVYDHIPSNLIFGSNHIPYLIILDFKSNIDLRRVVDSYKDDNVIITVRLSDSEGEYLPELFKINLHGYLLKGMKTSELIYAFNLMLKGNQYIHPKLVPTLFQQRKKISNILSNRPAKLLTNRQWDILELIVKGHKNQSIAKHLNIKEKTVKNHISTMFIKLNVSDRTNAVLYAIKNQWFSL
ncbi:response regulator transcription factor [Lederbergia citri]|uniref:Response regulator transcription factor n=1 Tax=Lederbergia citri TaxID=2833580 RepID=A0A942TGF6_9BACI|nr:response regulator transcription factor [Lederbergia citri]MBS4195712.1 response regulator transcription factor [Lederbergia citri]